MVHLRTLLTSALALTLGAPISSAADWTEVQKLKAKYLAAAARHAMEQQKTAQSPAVSIPLGGDVSIQGALKIAREGNDSLSIDVTAAPKARGKAATEALRIKLPRPADLFNNYSGLAVIAETASESSPEVRLGLRLLSGDKQAEIQPVLPALSAWGNRVHELYFDWQFLDFAKEEEAARVLKAVDAIEITFGSMRRAPERGPSEAASSARLTLSNLRLVDYLQGSYDPSRQFLTFDQTAGKWVPGGRYDLTLQHRTQEVTGIVATFGGEAGRKSALDSLDMAVRTQCWDGSFLDRRRGPVTVASGEYTFGFTLYGLLNGYQELERIKYPALDEKITIGPDTMSRRAFYQRMFYRGAMARVAATPSAYRDDIIGGNTLITGANRVLGYAIAMRMVADILTDPEKKKQVLKEYAPIMQEIAAAQGKFSGGFPILGEGDRYGGRGIHYDAGYTRTHMDWLVVGAARTGDPLLVEMLRRYQTVFEAAMDERGIGILPMISERGRGRGSVRLVLPDATFQAGVKYGLPVIAQWGYNCSLATWGEPEAPRGNHFASAGRARGYSLGALMSILADDMAAVPEPRDLGYLFPRQFPLWSTRTYSKDGKLQRTSTMVFHPDGTQESDYRIEVGEYPVTVGVPIAIKSAGKVTAVAESLSGWPRLLPEAAEVRVSGGAVAAGKVDQPIALTLQKETRLVITGPAVVLPREAGGKSVPFRAELTLMPESSGQVVEVTVLRGSVPYKYKQIAVQNPQ
jgi:hypothetical protein